MLLISMLAIISCSGESKEGRDIDIVGTWFGECGGFAYQGGELYSGPYILTFSVHTYEQDIDFHSDEECNSPRDESRKIIGRYEILEPISTTDGSIAYRIIFFEEEFETFSSFDFLDEPRSYEMAYRVEGDQLILGIIDIETQIADMSYADPMQRID